MSIHTQPAFAISQRAFLLRTPGGNVLWDCISLLDPATEEIIAALGGLAAIAISHPHYYSCMQDWARRFACPIWLHADDSAWIMRPDDWVRHFSDETIEILPGLTVIRLGGHFPGGTVLHWADGGGVILSGDIVQVAADTRRVSFLWSYPNMMPLPARTVSRIAATLAPLRFDRLYGAFVGKDIRRDASGIVARSAARYVELLEG
jgi:glyoxylase-like metal-dependent hydrolase (beta-lactamase superfamily II)